MLTYESLCVAYAIHMFMLSTIQCMNANVLRSLWLLFVEKLNLVCVACYACCHINRKIQFHTIYFLPNVYPYVKKTALIFESSFRVIRKNSIFPLASNYQTNNNKNNAYSVMHQVSRIKLKTNPNIKKHRFIKVSRF